LKHARGEEEEEEEEEEEAESWWWIVVYECAHRTKMYVMFVKDHPFVYLERPKKGTRIETVRLFVQYVRIRRTRSILVLWPLFLFDGSSIRLFGKTQKGEPG
jgi:hypothetical protein